MYVNSDNNNGSVLQEHMLHLCVDNLLTIML